MTTEHNEQSVATEVAGEMREYYDAEVVVDDDVLKRWIDRLAAPVTAAPVDGRDVRSAIAGLEGSVAVGSDGEWVSVRRAARDAAVMALRNVSLDCAHIYAAYSEAKASTPAAPGIDLAAEHEGMRVDYHGLLRQAQDGLRGEPGIAEMIRQLHDHLTELGRRWYTGDRRVVDEFLQLYCIESDARRTLIDASPKSDSCATCNGHGMVGGLLPAGGGYESEPCPHCHGTAGHWEGCPAPDDASPKGGSEACVWIEDDNEGNWYTACGDTFVLLEGSPAENNMRHCPFCGLALQASDAEVQP